jgi:hypothetical protein
MEDSIALAESLALHPNDIHAALVEFRRSREPGKNKLVLASEKSFNWYEDFGLKMDALAPVDFVFDFLMRTGRISRQRLAAEYPAFMDRYGPRWKPEEVTV